MAFTRTMAWLSDVVSRQLVEIDRGSLQLDSDFANLDGGAQSWESTRGSDFLFLVRNPGNLQGEGEEFYEGST